MKKRKQIASELKPDIIFDILLKVPLKSVVRFKSVSKQWCNQISDSVFARAHLLKHQEVTSFIIEIWDTGNPRISIIDVRETEEANSRGELLKPLNIPLPTIHSVRFGNCCDGILCASYSSGILLWNPITKWTKEIDYPHKPDDVCRDLVGFGYDSSIEDYKVVRISSRHIEVMNLKSNIWRTVSKVNPGCVYVPVPVHFNGILYWKIWHLSSDMIIGFDLRKEELRIVQTPPPKIEYRGFGDLTSFQGMLCLILPYINNGCEIRHEIWVMKEESNWVKVFDVKPKSIGYIPMCGIHEAVIFRRVIDGGPRFIVIDSKNGESYTSIDTSVFNGSGYIGAVYVGSLISPPS